VGRNELSCSETAKKDATMNPIWEVAGIVLLGALYKLAWRKQPDREPVLVRRTRQQINQIAQEGRS
jgi:hypothetical protein